MLYNTRKYYDLKYNNIKDNLIKIAWYMIRSLVYVINKKTNN